MGSFVDPRIKIGARIRAARMRHRWTQADLARRIGIPYQQVQRYERGRTLTLDRLIAIAEILGIEPSALMNWSDPWALGAPLGFYGRDASSKSIDADAQVRAMCGFPVEAPSRMIWEHWRDRIHPDDSAAVDLQLARLLDPRDGVFNMRYRLIGHDGIERTIIDRGHMIFDGVASRLQGIMLDITKLAIFIMPALDDIIAYGAG
jgi:transcriptional regulator with XRE-family HTH domain